MSSLDLTVLHRWDRPGADTLLLCNKTFIHAHLFLLHLQFTKAVEAKQVAQQDAERARFVVMKADQVCYLQHVSCCPSMILVPLHARHKGYDCSCCVMWLTQQQYDELPYLHVLQAERAPVHMWQERKAAVIRAEGESESARLISDATRIAGPGLIELRRIEAAKDVASTLSRSGNVVYLPHGNNMLLGLNPSMGGR